MSVTVTVTDDIRAALAAALNSPDLTLISGLGNADGGPASGERCTIAEINLVLTGKLSDDPHPCISEVIRQWVIRVQDRMPDSIRNSSAWRGASVGIAGSASTPGVEQARRQMVMDWMWERLGDEAVLEAIPAGCRAAWDRMLSERTCEASSEARRQLRAAAASAAAADDAAYVAAAAYSASAASSAAASAAAAAYVAASAAAYSASAAADDAASAAARQAFWERSDPAALLTRLIETH
jgi:hypothetical protein